MDNAEPNKFLSCLVVPVACAIGGVAMLCAVSLILAASGSGSVLDQYLAGQLAKSSDPFCVATRLEEELAETGKPLSLRSIRSAVNLCESEIVKQHQMRVIAHALDRLR